MALARHHHHLQKGIPKPSLAQEANPLRDTLRIGRQPQVKKHQLNLGVAFKHGQGIGGVGGLIHFMAQRLHQLALQRPKAWVVFNNQYSHRLAV